MCIPGVASCFAVDGVSGIHVSSDILAIENRVKPSSVRYSVAQRVQSSSEGCSVAQ